MLASVEQPPRVTFVADISDAGARIQERRIALGMTVKALAEKAGVDRGRLAKIEAGEVKARPSTIGAVESVLDRMEEEIGGPYDDERGLVTFRMSGNFGVDVVVQGPVENLPELERSVARLLREMRDSGD